MSATPQWALIIAYWLHMLATVVWIGGLAALAVIVLPSARKSLGSESYIVFLGGIQRRLQQVGWFSLLLLFGTGMFQMISHPSYQGFLSIDSPWAMAILLKHLTIGLMVIASAYITWVLTPKLQRLAILQSAGRSIDAEGLARLRKQESLLLQVNLWIAVVVLALTAWARAS